MVDGYLDGEIDKKFDNQKFLVKNHLRTKGLKSDLNDGFDKSYDTNKSAIAIKPASIFL